MPNGRKYTLDQRIDAARAQTLHVEGTTPRIDDNHDEARYADDGFVGSFTKLLHHGEDGALNDQGALNYRRLVKALNTGAQADFNAVERANAGEGPSRVFVNPQASFATTLEGGDISLFSMPAAPRLASPEAAAEMLEVYLYLLCRDVPFEAYGSAVDTDCMASGDSLTAFAADTLTRLGRAYRGPKEADGRVSIDLLFRGVTEGERAGPYVSQYLLQPLYPLFPSGCAPFVGGLIGVGELDQDALARPQHFPVPGPREFGVNRADFLAIQDGHIPFGYEIGDYLDIRRYITNGRDLGSLVHTDSPYEAYYNALGILAYRDARRTPASPYVRGEAPNEGDGHSLGIPDAYGIIAQACLEAFKAAWFQKWRVHRRLRPEAMAGLVDRVYAEMRGKGQRKGKGQNEDEVRRYGLSPLLFNNEVGGPVLEQVFARRGAGNVLLPQMYPEGSPAHPAYPSGHATVAGACTTVMKALFDQHRPLRGTGDDTPYGADLFEPYRLTQAGGLEALSSEAGAGLTVGTELDKLASNIAYGRNFGGVHFRSDGDEGMALGEAVALRLLQDHARVYHEAGFKGFVLTKRDGSKVHINPEGVREI